MTTGLTGSSVNKLKQLADDLIKSKREDESEKVPENGDKFLAVLEKLDKFMILNDNYDDDESKLAETENEIY